VVASARIGVALLAGFALGAPLPAAGVTGARPAGDITITMLANAVFQPGWDALIANFERAYPNIKVSITYTPTSAIGYQLETTELAAGGGPDILATNPGCGTPISICTLARAGDLAPMVKKPWASRSLPLVTSLAKRGPVLYAYTAVVSPYGLFTNDDLFKKLGLTVPRTFAQLLALCARAKADGTTAVIVAGGAQVTVEYLTTALAVATLYGKDATWAGRLRAGKVTFEGTPGWHRALQDFIDMNSAGCFSPGVVGTSPSAATAEFAQGEGLMLADPSNFKGSVDASSPRFSYSFHPFPGGTKSLLDPGNTLSVNAHSSTQAQNAAQTFVDFVARPKQDALFARLTGGLTQYEFLKRQLPGFMSPFASVLREKAYVVNPFKTWWNAAVSLALQEDGIGLITGQLSVDGVLKAMDAAWKQGPD
jgi:raffinose/stachyose/melibiose transport system substrate-binding protein